MCRIMTSGSVNDLGSFGLPGDEPQLAFLPPRIRETDGEHQAVDADVRAGTVPNRRTAVLAAQRDDGPIVEAEFGVDARHIESGALDLRAAQLDPLERRRFGEIEL